MPEKSKYPTDEVLNTPPANDDGELDMDELEDVAGGVGGDTRVKDQFDPSELP